MPKTKPNVFDGQNITASEFFKTHWQRSPHLFKNTLLDFNCLPDKATLFALAAQEDVQSRIIYTDDDRSYQAIYDEPEAWDEVLQQKPTLLVSDIEKWYPQAGQLMQWFPFIKNWRFDDLMMSYAPTGASVGAHTDHYDVFLVQVQGTRQWSFDTQPLAHKNMVENSELAVIDGYIPEVTHELKPGDVLYLPPEIPHHGISTSDDCITCSIGLRAPSQSELLTAVIELASQNMAEVNRFKDDVSSTNNNASIGPHEVQYLRGQLNQLATADDHELAKYFGQFVTGYRLFDETPEEVTTPDKDLDGLWQKSPFSVFAYHSESRQLFVNGEALACSPDLAQAICNQDQYQLSSLKILGHDEFSTQRLLNYLIEIQALVSLS